jgi:hypothetical protein
VRKFSFIPCALEKKIHKNKGKKQPKKERNFRVERNTHEINIDNFWLFLLSPVFEGKEKRRIPLKSPSITSKRLAKDPFMTASFFHFFLSFFM